MKLLAHKSFVSLASDPDKLKKHGERKQYNDWVKNYKPVSKETVLDVLKNAKSSRKI